MKIQLTLDTVNRWTGFVSLLNLASIVERIQEASFVKSSNDIPLMANSDEDQSEAQASSGFSDSGPEPLQRSLEAILSEETGKFIWSFGTMISSTMALGMVVHDVLESASSDSVPSSNALFTPPLKQVALLIAIVYDDFRAKFPLPVTAPGHAARVKRVSKVLGRLQQLVVRLARDYEIEQEVIERHLARVKPLLHDVGVLIGDVAELYPGAIEALVVLLPEAMFLRSLVILYCSGPYVFGKDAISGWLLKHVSETLRV
ncbi:hypothetical protein J3R82DRAFT_3765 [Butyriboletus roseoflavus]|nr:hypothetical protein J3R82DRAFT_3765 [Butyriboletus roseoflavus]